MAKAFLYVSASYVGFVLLKNGALQTLIADSSKGAQDLAGGLKGLTNNA